MKYFNFFEPFQDVVTNAMSSDAFVCPPYAETAVLEQILDENDPLNPIASNNSNAGLDFWRTPKQTLFVRQETLGKTGDCGFADGIPDEPRVDPEERYEGSQELVRLVRDCTRFDLLLQPELRTVKTRILRHTTRAGEDYDHAEGLRRNAIDSDNKHLNLLHPRDKYRICLAWLGLKGSPTDCRGRSCERVDSRRLMRGFSICARF